LTLIIPLDKVPYGTEIYRSEGFHLVTAGMAMPSKVSTAGQAAPGHGELGARRRRILNAAFSAFMKEGYAATSTLEIATRARVSKRSLYHLVGAKQEILAACIGERARRLHVPADMTVPADRDELARALTTVGARLIREISDPTVIGVFRLAIAEAVTAPEVAWALDSIGRNASRAALRDLMTRAHAADLVSGNPAKMAEQFAGLLWSNLMVSLLLRVVERPTEEEIAQRAHSAATGFLKLYQPPEIGVVR
jgi:AcrR family transcriptional regulator